MKTKLLTLIQNYGLFAILAIVSIPLFYNLNYNSAFNDEAIYIAIGKFGAFDNNWEFFNAISWMVGHPFFYPPLTALAYMTGGLVLSRGVNVGIFIVFLVVYYLTVKEVGFDKHNKKQALVATTFIAFSSISYYVARLATYDMSSYLFFLLTIFTLIKTIKTKNYNLYFLASLFFLISFGFKYVTALYLPLLFVIPLIAMYKDKKARGKILLIFTNFVFPVCVILAYFGLVNFENLQILYFGQIANEPKQPLIEVLEMFVISSNISLIPALVGSYVLIKNKKNTALLVLLLTGFWILISHITSSRVHTLDKHTFITVSAISAIAGLSFPLITKKIKNNLLALVICLYIGISLVIAQRYNSLWLNTNRAHEVLIQHITPSSIVLTEHGAATNLALLKIVKPDNIITFDYLFYDESEGIKAYELALNDSYFTHILLISEDALYFSNYPEIHDLVLTKLENYHLIYEDENSALYELNTITEYN